LSQTFLRITDRLSINQKKFIAEVAGTFIVVTLATGSVVIDAKQMGLSGIAIGGIVGLDIFFLAFISGASMNPARSLAPGSIVWCNGKSMAVLDSYFYWGPQPLLYS
jgi:glycerol uptake facilitator-like aquaporin